MLCSHVSGIHPEKSWSQSCWCLITWLLWISVPNIDETLRRSISSSLQQVEWDGDLLLWPSVGAVASDFCVDVWWLSGCAKEDASLVRMNWGLLWMEEPNTPGGGHLYLLTETIKQRAQHWFLFLSGGCKETAITPCWGGAVWLRFLLSFPTNHLVSLHVMAYGTHYRVSPSPELSHLWQKSTK